MYNPSQPNVYRTVRLEQERVRRREKRARDAASAEAEEHELRLKQQQQMSASLASTMMFEAANNDNALFQQDNSSTGQLSSLSSSPFGGDSMWGNYNNNTTMDSHDYHDNLLLPPLSPLPSTSLLVGGGLLDAATLVKERVTLSAALGVTTAKAMLQDDEEVRHKEKVQQGSDMSSRVGKLLGKLNAASAGLAAGGSGASSTTTTTTVPLSSGDTLSSPANESSNKNNNKVGHLVFVPSTLAAGGHVMQRVSSNELAKKDKKIGGKPSSTFFVTLLDPNDDSNAAATNNSNNNAFEEIDQLLGPWVCRALQLEAAACGVVRSSRRWSSQDNNVVTTTTIAEANVPSSSSCPPPPPRMFLRFDSVASSFKAAEKLDGRTFEEFCATNGLTLPPPATASAADKQRKLHLRVVFYPTAQYDANTFDAVVV